MRLLKYDDNGNISLTEFDEGNIPEYAILSHTWEQDDGKEVTYADMISGTGQDKDGFKKIRFCARQARKDGLLYSWVDTCCINKQNKAELSYSINSMFRWYRNASRCYVSLSDVPTREQNASDRSSEHTWIPSFQDSRWFTRGWTLQELLAPASVEFFSYEGERLGDKSSLQKQICKATNISPSALRGESLSQFHTDERMRWIEHRQTGREEDKAYSMLGIFGVSMVPMYGEGVAKAFDRLWEKFRQIQECMQDLRLTDPRDDKERIEATKGGLIKEAYQWVIETTNFRQWRTSQHDRSLWIKGDAGKGKTMLLCGIVDELQKSLARSALLSYFFCQATDFRINNATAVLRGLIYLLVDQQPPLISHVQTSYDKAGKALFEDVNAWVALTKIFSGILQDPNLNDTYLIVDALDECVDGLPGLLDFIAQTSSISPHVRWVISSRNWPEIEKMLDTTVHEQRLCLELNADSVSAAVTTFIQAKVHDLSMRNRYKTETRDAVQEYLSLNAHGTFLWVALVCQELSNLSGWKAVQRLKALPPGLNALYQRMLDQIMASEDSELCMSILAVVTTVYRPITVDELVNFVDMPSGVEGEYEAIAEIIGYCRSYLVIRDRTIFFVHQSAKDFLVKKAPQDPLLFKTRDVHNSIFSRSLKAMSQILKRDVYNLRAPGTSIDTVEPPVPDPLASVRYSCLYWADHLLDCQITENRINHPKDNGLLHSFLRQYFLYWLEALSLLKSVSVGIVILRKLEDLQVCSLKKIAMLLENNTNISKSDESPDLSAFIYDAKRFITHSRSIIERAPLQVYCSALIFSPEKSIVRQEFEGNIPSWIERKPRVETNWNAILQVLEGHAGGVWSVAFSPDGSQIVSGSVDKTVRRWDAATGQLLLPILEGHIGQVRSVTFSPDGNQIASGSDDETIRLWDVASGHQSVLEGHTSTVMSVAFTQDGKQIVSGSHDTTIRFWDVATGQQLLPALDGHRHNVNSVALAPDGKYIVCQSYMTIWRWDMATRQKLVLEGHTAGIKSVAFSPDGKQIVSGSDDRTIRRWDVATGQQLQLILGHTGPVTSVSFSPNSEQIVSGSFDATVRCWDATTGQQLSVFKGHNDAVCSVAFSPDSKQIVSGGSRTILHWDVAIGQQLLRTSEDHLSNVKLVAFSPDGEHVLSWSGGTIQRWDIATGPQPLQTLENPTGKATVAAFSPDGKQIVCTSGSTIQRWETTTGQQLLPILEGHKGPVLSIAFSPDSKLMVSGSRDMTICQWDVATGQQLLPALKGHANMIWAIVFSPDGRLIVSGSNDRTARRWDTATGQELLPVLEGHTSPIYSVAFSPDGKQIVTGSSDRTVRRWDAVTGQQILLVLDGYIGLVKSVAFSPDGKQIVSRSDDNIVRHWETSTGQQLPTALKGYTDRDGKEIPNLYVYKNWLMDGDTDLLWIPPSYRPTCDEATWGGKIALGYQFGVLTFQIPPGPKLVT